MTTLQVDAVETLRESPSEFLLSLVWQVGVIGALLALGYLVGSWIESIVVRLGQRSDLDEIVGETPLDALFGDGDDAASRAFGVVAKLYVVLLALLGAFTYLGFDQVSHWLQRTAAYAPIFVAGVVLLIVGFYVADRAGSVVASSATAQATGVPEVFGEVTEALLVFVAVVIALDTIGVQVGILYAFGETLALAAGLAVALAVGIAFGWGAKDYVAENIASWHEETGETSASD